MFISSYFTIYFFVKNIIFPNVFISVITIFECLYMFLLRKGPQLSTYATAGGMGEGHPKCVQLRTGTEGCYRHGTYALSPLTSISMF